MSSSAAGSGLRSFIERMNRSRSGPTVCPAAGSQRDHGATEVSSASLRGPVRRSYRGARELRQLPAACDRSAEVNSNWTSFSASANVEVDTCGPTAGAVPNAGGAPAGGSPVFGCFLLQAAAAPINPNEVFRKWRRDLDMNHIVAMPGVL